MTIITSSPGSTSASQNVLILWCSLTDTWSVPNSVLWGRNCPQSLCRDCGLHKRDISNSALEGSLRIYFGQQDEVQCTALAVGKLVYQVIWGSIKTAKLYDDCSLAITCSSDHLRYRAWHSAPSSLLFFWVTGTAPLQKSAKGSLNWCFSSLPVTFSLTELLQFVKWIGNIA